jgi:hypothetical protein
MRPTHTTVRPAVAPHRQARRVVFLAVALALTAPISAAAQAIEFRSDLPRTLVFIAEAGEGGVATRDVAGFLREAGFPLVDPALAHTAAHRDLVRAALAGDEGAAVQLGRDFGAHVLVLGRADWGAAPDPVSGSLLTATSEVELRALRLDEGRVVATGRGSGRKLEATEQAARTGAIRDAVTSLIERTEFVGSVVNSWDEKGWSARGYFQPDPGSLGAALSAAAATAGAGPRLAILRTDVAPPPEGGPATRGIGVVRRGSGSFVNHVEIEGVALGALAGVEVEGAAARLSPVDPAEARRLGIQDAGPVTRFVATTTLPSTRDTVRVVARAPGGETSTATAAPRINRRWAVVVGVSDYRSDAIPDLAYAGKDAQAIYDFLRSPAAGPFDEDKILFLRDGQATAQAMREAMFVFLQRAAWDDLVLIYFAGHGAPDPTRPENLYLLPHDADLDALASTAFPMWDVKTALRRQIAAERVIVIADACHSGGTQEGLQNPIGGSFAELFTPSRRLTLTAADTNELSFEDTRWGGGHGAFTWFLLEGLRGAADADNNGIVTFSEVTDYVAGKVSETTQGRQNPQRTGLGDVPLAVTN